LNRAKDQLGVDFDYAEPKQISDFELIIRDMASSGEYKVIVLRRLRPGGSAHQDRSEFPRSAVCDYRREVDAPNVVNYTCKEEEGSFWPERLPA
jgi:basic membrane protein A